MLSERHMNHALAQKHCLRDDRHQRCIIMSLFVNNTGYEILDGQTLVKVMLQTVCSKSIYCIPVNDLKMTASCLKWCGLYIFYFVKFHLCTIFIAFVPIIR